MANVPYVWVEQMLDKRAAQLGRIGENLTPAFGVTEEEVLYWRNGAAMNSYLQTQIIALIRDFSTAVTAARDELQLGKAVADFEAPTMSLPAPPILTGGAPPLQTDFLGWCDRLFQRMKLNGLPPSEAKAIEFLVSGGAPTHRISDLKPRLISMFGTPGGKISVTTTRENQKMVHVQITLDTDVVLEKTLPGTRFSFEVPTDRPHILHVRACYTDAQGEDIGHWSDIKTATSEI